MKKILLIMAFLLIACPSWSATHYVRTDGGTGNQCDGLTDHALAGASGTNCAVNHPNWIFPPRSENSTRKASAGDIVVIESGSYRVGCQNAANCRDATYNLTNSGFCASAFPYDCVMSNGSTSLVGIPANVTVIGCTTSGCSTATSRPELWGAGRATYILKVASSGVILQDLIIHDHDTCGSGNPTLGCGSADSSELSARDGILATGSTNLSLINVDVKGMFHNGITADFTNSLSVLGNSNIEYNALAGIDFDTCSGASTCAPTGTLTLGNATYNNPNKMVSISWNGCVEDKNNYNNAATNGCYNDNNGGYGDGLGSGRNGATWNLNYAKFLHNTSDGFDELYHDTGLGTISIQNSIFGGNVGNQVKFSGNSTIYNTVVEGDCDFFVGKTYATSGMTHCRAGGDAISATFQSGTTIKWYGNTINRNTGNDAFTITARNAGNCTSANTLDIQNIVAVANGKSSVLGGGPVGWINKDSTCTNSVVTQINSNIYNYGSNPSGTGNVFTNANLSGTLNGTTYAVGLQLTSPAKDLSNNTAPGQPSTDFNAFSRVVPKDSGALEYGSSYGGVPPDVCGDGTVSGTELCDDGNNTDGDGCSSTCSVESGYSCTGSPSVCTAICGDGNIDDVEECDDHNTTSSDGCSSTCTIETGYTCTGEPSVCTATCGNGAVGAGEECDDGNTTNSDGCSAICQTEIPGYQKLLLYTETDPSSNLARETHKVTVAGVTNAVSANIKYDFGANYFQDFTHRFRVEVDSCQSNPNGFAAYNGIWGISASSIDDTSGLDVVSGMILAFKCQSASNGYVWEFFGDTAVDTYTDVIPTIVRYIEVQRIGGTMTAKLYSDSTFTTLLHTLTLTGESAPERFYYPFITYNAGFSDTSFSGNVSNITLASDAQQTEQNISVTVKGGKLVGCSIH